MRQKNFLRTIFFSLFMAFSFLLSFNASADAPKVKKSATEVAIGKECASCHMDDNPGIVTE